MKRILTIDQGNTAAKAVVFDGDAIAETLRFDTFGVEQAAALLARTNPYGVAYCAVGHMDARLAESLARMSPRVLICTNRTPVPMRIDYGTPHTLGIDRVCAALGACALYPDATMLVADAGTALTLDIAAPGPTFLGGTISAGASMRLRALNAYTHRLPLVELTPAAQTDPAFGTDTASALRIGALRGAAAEIADAARRAVRAFGASRTLLTGGEAPAIIPYIDSPELEPELQPHLVALGLKSIFLYNETK